MNPGLILLYGYPIYLYIGILTFLSLLATATLGMLCIKGKFGVKFALALGNGSPDHRSCDHPRYLCGLRIPALKKKSDPGQVTKMVPFMVGWIAQKYG